MSKIPSLVKVHAYGGGVNDSFWVSVEEYMTMYNIYLVYPGSGMKIPRCCVPNYDVKKEIMTILSSIYQEYDVEQINLTWLYDEHGLEECSEPPQLVGEIGSNLGD